MQARVLIAVTHLLGSGHLVRARHLASALSEAGHQVTLASGGMPLRGPEDERYAFVQLPPVKIEGIDFRSLLDEAGEPITAARRAARQAMLVDLVGVLRPDVVITEHFPFGRRQLAGEFLALIEAARAANPQMLALSSIRDVLVTPRPDRIAEAEARLEAHFDGVLVHGDESFLPLAASWPVGEALRRRLHYTGYLTAPRHAHPSTTVFAAVAQDRPARSGAFAEMSPAASLHGESRGYQEEILVSGGGSAAALPLFELCIATAGRMGDARRWRVLVGRGMSDAGFAALAATAPTHVKVEWSRPDFPGLLASCALSISQAGYNTVLDLVAAGRPALVIPFDEGGETEQAIRARAMERAGLARCLRYETTSPAMLALAISDALRQGPPPPIQIDRDGGAATAAILAGLLVGRR